MPHIASKALPLGTLILDPSGVGGSLHQQLYMALRQAILDGSLRPGTRLPATRTLARDLSVSRNTVTTAYEQLQAEGYVAGRTGAGNYVSDDLPEHLLQAPAADTGTSRQRSPARLSRRGQRMASMRRLYPTGAAAFAPGMPELRDFPFHLWTKLLARHWRHPATQTLVMVPPAGHEPLRDAIAGYLGATRGVRCRPAQVVIVSGSQQAIDLVARLLIDPGDDVWVEEPGYLGTRGALRGAGANIVPVPVDDGGLKLDHARRVAPAARLACVCPSHQYPLGVTMSLPRRLALLEWARDHDGYILEDDYDSEFRYAGRPLAALQGLDTDARVIYVGTFSKVMFPGMRLGYLVMPEDLLQPLLALRLHVDGHPSTLGQAALADFITEGHLATHIRRMRTLYATRQQTLLKTAARRTDRLILRPDEAGMHLVAGLPDSSDDRAIATRARERGVITGPLSLFYQQPEGRTPGLLLGYAGFNETEITRGMTTLAGVLRD